MRKSASRVLITVWVTALIVLCAFGAYLVAQLMKDVAPAGTISTESGSAVVPPSQPVRKITLYFGAPGAQGLTAETRELRINKNEDTQDLIRRVLDELIRGPASVLVPTVPADTTVNSIFLLKGGQLTIDFGKEIRDHNPGGSCSEIMTIYSIVDTLTENFDEVKTVKFLIEGSEVETLVGHFDLTEPVLPDPGRIVVRKDTSL